MQQQVAGGDGLEHRGPGSDGRGGLAGPIRIAQVFAIRQEGEFHEGGQTGRTIQLVDLLRACTGGLADHGGKVAGRIGADFQADGIGEAAGGEHVLHFIGEVDGVLFLHGDVAIAGDAEGGGGSHVFARKQAGGVDRDEILDEDKSM